MKETLGWLWSIIWNNKIIAGAVIVIISLVLYNRILQDNLTDTKAALSISSNNETAYKAGLIKWEDRYGQEHAKTILFNENLSNFKENQDSITQELVAIIKDQGISLSKLQSASIIQTKVSTSLTKEIQSKLPDTVVDMSTKDIRNILTFTPYKITSDIELLNTQSIIATDSTYKVFIPYRKSFFLARWLQHKEKNTLVNIEVINSNPLIKTVQQRFIHIIKPKD